MKLWLMVFSVAGLILASLPRVLPTTTESLDRVTIILPWTTDVGLGFPPPDGSHPGEVHVTAAPDELTAALTDALSQFCDSNGDGVQNIDDLEELTRRLLLADPNLTPIDCYFAVKRGSAVWGSTGE